MKSHSHRMFQFQYVSCRDQMRIRRRHVDNPRLEKGVIRRFLDAHARSPRQQLHQRTLMRRTQMLDNNNAGTEIFREPIQYLAQSKQTTSGGANNHYIEFSARCALLGLSRSN
ncbi:MAG: hypothetical protein JWO20_1714 [Candidatus Angelobacter sp.]|nr:hypothetical protein [Candidatus Angelobacter sp.]